MTRKRRHALEAAAAAIVSAIVRRLPRGAVRVAGRWLGRIWAALDRRHLRIAEENLRLAFPEWDEPRVRATALGVYSHFAEVLLEILWMEGRPVKDLLALTEVTGLEHMQAALARGRGVVSPIAHLGNWELQGVATAPLIGPSAVIARPLDNAALDRRLVSFRASTGNVVIYKQKALAQIIKTLREGRVVAVMLDQNVQAGDGIFVRFFGRPACTTTVAAALAIKTGAAIVPAHCVRHADGRYRMAYGPEVESTGSGRRDEDIKALTQQITSVIEGWVRQTPEQWLWLHRRWKTQSPETPLAQGVGGSLVSPAASAPGSTAVPTPGPVSGTASVPATPSGRAPSGLGAPSVPDPTPAARSGTPRDPA